MPGDDEMDDVEIETGVFKDGHIRKPTIRCMRVVRSRRQP
jgi:hypothetical protein